MNSVSPMPAVYGGETEGESVVCPVCDEEIHLIDAYSERKDASSGEFMRVHRACTEEGVKRWNRENRPLTDPLTADRARWSWSPTV